MPLDEIEGEEDKTSCHKTCHLPLSQVHRLYLVALLKHVVGQGQGEGEKQLLAYYERATRKRRGYPLILSLLVLQSKSSSRRCIVVVQT